MICISLVVQVCVLYRDLFDPGETFWSQIDGWFRPFTADPRPPLRPGHKESPDYTSVDGLECRIHPGRVWRGVGSTFPASEVRPGSG